MPTVRCVRSTLLGLALLVVSAPAMPAAPALGAVPPPPAGVPEAPSATVGTPVSAESASHSLGLMLGDQLNHNGLAAEVRVEALIQGLKEGLAGTSAGDAQRAEANQFLRAGRAAVAERNRAAAREFLAQNAKAPGVHTTPSGLQYRVLADGDAHGAPPAAGDQVTVQYRAALTDGKEVDSSYAHGQPATVRMSSIIRGWQEALLMMKPGAKWQLFVPPDLAYGAATPPAIPPGALLVYELELIRIEAPARPAPAAHSGGALMPPHAPAHAGAPPATAMPTDH